MWSNEYAHVPSVADDAEVDPHWLALRGASLLPPSYMPPSMAGAHSRSSRATSLVLIAVFVLATALGVCLTYGPQFVGG